MRAILAAMLGFLLIRPAMGPEPPGYPAAIVAWEPTEANPVFEGTGGEAWDAKIRERGWILVEERDLSALVHRL